MLCPALELLLTPKGHIAGQSVQYSRLYSRFLAIILYGQYVLVLSLIFGPADSMAARRLVARRARVARGRRPTDERRRRRRRRRLLDLRRRGDGVYAEDGSLSSGGEDEKEDEERTVASDDDDGGGESSCRSGADDDDDDEEGTYGSATASSYAYPGAGGCRGAAVRRGLPRRRAQGSRGRGG